MHPVFRPRHMLLAAAVLALGLLPVYAQRPLGNADPVTVLAGGNINGTGAVTGTGCANGTISGTVSFSGGTQTGAACASALSDLANARASLAALGGSTIVSPIGTTTISPGNYSISGDAAITASSTVTLSGNGVYVFNISGNLSVGNSVTIALANGANANNVYFNVNGNITIGQDDILRGIFLAGGTITTGGTSGETLEEIDGKVQAQGDVTFGANTTVVETLTSPPPSNGFSFPTPSGSGVVVNSATQTISVCAGDSYTFTATATAPGTDTAQLSVGTGPSNLTFNPNVGGVDTSGPNSSDVLNTGTTTTSSDVTFAPTLAQQGTSTAVTFYSEDLTTSVISTTTVTFVVPVEPTISMPTNVSNATPFGSGSGAVGNPLAVCASVAFASMPLQFDIPTGGATGESVTLTSSPSPSNLSITPTGPQPAGTTFHVVFTPGAVDSLDTFTFTVTSSPSGCTASEQVQIRTDLPPTFNAPALGTATTTALPTPPNGSTVIACVGETLQFDVSASDTDGAALLVVGTDTRTENGLPLGAIQSPNEFGTDIFGGLFSSELPTAPWDLLAGLLPGVTGSPMTTVSSRFEWTPTANDLAYSSTYALTYASVDLLGCVTLHTINIQLINTPTISATVGGNAVTANQVLSVCPGQQTLTIPVTGSVTPGDSVTLSATGLPSGATFAPLTGTGSVIGTITYAPPAGTATQDFNVVVTATDTTVPAGNQATGGAVTQCSAAASLPFTIHVGTLPTIQALDNTTSAPLPSTTPTFTTCPSNTVTFRVRATSPEGGNVTISGPSISVDQEGAPTLTTTNTPTLPTTGNPAETVVSLVAPVVDVDTTYTLTYTATDANGCTSTVSVTILDQAPVPSFLNDTLTVTVTPPGPIEVNSQVCYTVTVVDQCGNPIPNFPVTFTEVGTAGITGDFMAVTPVAPAKAGSKGKLPTGLVVVKNTDANGQATACLTVLTPGTITVTASGPGISGTVTSNTTVTAPTSSFGCFVSGSGIVDSVSGSAIAPATFNADLKVKQNGRVNGQLNFSIPVAGPGRGNHSIKGRTTALTSLTCGDVPGGRAATLIGTMRVDAPGVTNATFLFRADFLDMGTPGVPNDRLTITFFNPDGSINPLSFGSNLRYVRGSSLKVQNDIKIRTGVSVP